MENMVKKAKDALDTPGKFIVYATHVISIAYEVDAKYRNDAIGQVVAGEGSHAASVAKIEAAGFNYEVAISPALWNVEKKAD